MRPRQEDVFEAFAREFIRRHQGPRPLWPVERILVATDFSLCSLTALEYAEELARRFDAELLLLQADEVPVTSSEWRASRMPPPSVSSRGPSSNCATTISRRVAFFARVRPRRRY